MYNVLASEDITKDHKECSKRASNGQPYLRTSAYSCKYFTKGVAFWIAIYVCMLWWQTFYQLSCSDYFGTPARLCHFVNHTRGKEQITLDDLWSNQHNTFANLRQKKNRYSPYSYMRFRSNKCRSLALCNGYLFPYKIGYYCVPYTSMSNSQAELSYMVKQSLVTENDACRWTWFISRSCSSRSQQLYIHCCSLQHSWNNSYQIPR